MSGNHDTDAEMSMKKLLAASDKENLIKMKHVFDSAPENALNRNELRKYLFEILNISFNETQFNVLFLKMDLSRTNTVSWDEFISHILLCFVMRDGIENQEFNDELVPPIRSNPRIVHSHHPQPIICICFCPESTIIQKDSPIQGFYITVSSNGTVNQWSLDFIHKQTCKLQIDLATKNSFSTVTVLTATYLEDFNVVVISTSQKELQFYDTTANQLTLRTSIANWENSIVAMHYYAARKANDDVSEKIAPRHSLLLGDDVGNIYIIEFSSRLKGPFQKTLQTILNRWSYKCLLQKRIYGMRVKEILGAHTTAIRQVSFYSNLSSVISCSESTNSVNMFSILGPIKYNIFRAPEGVKCFTFNEEKNILVTGGRDTIVRIWNVFINSQPNTVLRGHRAPIVALVLQNNSRRLYSLDENRVVKAWSIHNRVCLQTYIEIPSSIGEHTLLAVTYNAATRELIIGSMQIVVLACQPKLNIMHTDGFTHSMPVSIVIHNPLFNIIITCATDSIIMSWDLETGRRQHVIHKAHTITVNGEDLPMEITAATSSPSNQLLVTGARDGTLKVWNITSKTCLRQMSIEHMNQVTSIIWIDGKILASGWNKRITEFDDGLTMARMMGKAWETRHFDDISAAANRSKEALATVSFSGELVLWRLDTGRPVCQFSCESPYTRIKIDYKRRNANLKRKSERVSISVRKSLYSGIRTSIFSPFEGSKSFSISPKTYKDERKSLILTSQYSMAAHAVIFLETRPVNENTGNLLIALSNGSIQVWSEHAAGGYLGSFTATHTDGDYVNCFTTDPQNMYLFCGTVIGYIKIWLLQNYFLDHEVHVNMPQLRLTFPFLMNDHIIGRAKRHARHQPLPLLCSSFRAHLRCIKNLVYIPVRNYILSGSADSSVRIWMLNGQYLNTLGTFLPWKLEPHYPPDVLKIASSTTLKVWNAGELPQSVNIFTANKLLQDMNDNELLDSVKHVLPTESELERVCRLPRNPPPHPYIKIDASLSRTPIYKHLDTSAEIEEVNLLHPVSHHNLQVSEKKIHSTRLTRDMRLNQHKKHKSRP